MPEEEIACRARLRALGATFEERESEGDARAGCSLPHPIWLTRLGPRVALEPGALVNCKMAETATRFTTETMEPAARQIMKKELAALSQASAYVCRPRAGTNTLSEHAFGNALDTARFAFEGGEELIVTLQPSEDGERFLDRVRERACGPFKTVLGPGADADHANHLHLDLAQRRNGGTFCQ